MSSGKSMSDAQTYLKIMSEFRFIITGVIIQYILKYVRPISVPLQSKLGNHFDACERYRRRVGVLKSQRNIDTFKQLYSRAIYLLNGNYETGKEPKIERVSTGKRQIELVSQPGKVMNSI